MTLLKIINEGGQWVAIGFLLVLLFTFDIDFFESVPKRVTDLESKQEQHDTHIKSIEERLSQIDSDMRVFKNSQNARELQEQIDILRSDIENITSPEIGPSVSQPEITTANSNVTDDIEAQVWYWQGYIWAGAAVIAFMFILFMRYVKKRKRKATLLVIQRSTNDQTTQSKRNCA